jgi:hypothetical protein
MTVMRWSSLLTLLIALTGCATTVPYEKSRYVGEWEGEKAYLFVAQDGYVYYERRKGWFYNTVEGRLKGFKGDNIQVGFGPIAATIVVNTPPFYDRDGWKMVVDGMELLRVPD